MKNISMISTTSAGVDITGVGFDLNDLKSCSISVVFTGSNVVGTLKLQASNDDLVWFDVPNTTTSVTASGDVFYNIDVCSYRYIRLVWTYTSGTGNITAGLFLKEPIVRFS